MGDLTTVYKYFAANGALLYVGITSRAERRAHEHAESKDWWRLAVGCTLEHFESREQAEARERALIEIFRPPYNRQHNPERSMSLERRVSVRLQGRRDPSLAERRKAYYELPTELKRVAPCVVCGQANDVVEPSCSSCFERVRCERSRQGLTRRQARGNVGRPAGKGLL